MKFVQFLKENRSGNIALLEALSPAKLAALSKKYKLDTSFDTHAKHKTPEDIVNYFADEADPTTKKEYLDWILRQYNKENFRQEDTYRVKEILEKFVMYKHKMENSDILAYKTLKDLRDAVNEISGTVSVKGQDLVSTKIQGAPKVYESSDIAILKIETKKAALIVGKNTEWCTSAQKSNGEPSERNAFDQYIKSGPLFVVIDKHKTNEKGNRVMYQYQVNTNQFMDSDDNPISKEDFESIKPALWKAWDKDPSLLD